MVVRWTFEDPNTLESWTVPINPNEGGSPGLQRNIQYQSTCAPDGKVVTFEGRDLPQTLEFSGVILTQEHLDLFVTWFEKRYQLSLTDDLGRQYMIVFDTFTPKRERAHSYPWKHSYTASATIVDWP